MARTFSTSGFNPDSDTIFPMYFTSLTLYWSFAGLSSTFASRSRASLEELPHDLTILMLTFSGDNYVIKYDLHTIDVSKYGFILLLEGLWCRTNAKWHPFETIAAIWSVERAKVRTFIVNSRRTCRKPSFSSTMKKILLPL